jgi:hypothetical protein
VAVTLINVFKVREQHEDMFLRTRNETTSVYARTEGFIDTDAPQHRGGKPELHLRQCRHLGFEPGLHPSAQGYVPGEESIPGVEFYPAIYEEIIVVKNLLSRQSEGKE